MTTFRINRVTWLRGDPDKSMLLNEEGNMCCLGNIARQCNIEPDDIIGRSTPVEIDREVDKLYSRLFIRHYNDHKDSSLAIAAMSINDNTIIDDEQREKELTELFEKYGVKIEFYN